MPRSEWKELGRREAIRAALPPHVAAAIAKCEALAHADELWRCIQNPADALAQCKLFLDGLAKTFENGGMGDMVRKCREARRELDATAEEKWIAKCDAAMEKRLAKPPRKPARKPPRSPNTSRASRAGSRTSRSAKASGTKPHGFTAEDEAFVGRLKASLTPKQIEEIKNGSNIVIRCRNKKPIVLPPVEPRKAELGSTLPPLDTQPIHYYESWGRSHALWFKNRIIKAVPLVAKVEKALDLERASLLEKLFPLDSLENAMESSVLFPIKYDNSALVRFIFSCFDMETVTTKKEALSRLEAAGVDFAEFYGKYAIEET